jgi:hypothetical protein
MRQRAFDAKKLRSNEAGMERDCPKEGSLSMRPVAKPPLMPRRSLTQWQVHRSVPYLQKWKCSLGRLRGRAPGKAPLLAVFDVPDAAIYHTPESVGKSSFRKDFLEWRMPWPQQLECQGGVYIPQ